MNNILYISLFFLCFNASSQEQISTATIDVASPHSIGWILYVDNQDFLIEYKFTDCDPAKGFDFEGVLLKVTNLTTHKLSLSWHKILYYAGGCRTCDYPDEYNYEISLDANESIEGDCASESGYNLKLFSKFIDQQYSQGDKLTAFQLDKLIVTQY